MVESAESLAVLDPVGRRSEVVLPAPPIGGISSIRGVRLVLAAVLGTRLLVWASSLATIAIFGENGIARRMLDPLNVAASLHAPVLNTLVAPAVRWDSVWYLQIAAHGYFSPASANFFPVYPLLVHLATPLFGGGIPAGIAISLGSMVLALTLLYRLVELDLDEPAARMSVMLVAVFPTSLFLSADYSASLFLLLTVAAVYAARRERWAVAGICGGLAAASRSVGIPVVILLALMYLYGPRDRTPSRSAATAWWRPRFPIERNIGWLALVPAGLAAYLGYLWIAHGAPLAPYRAAHLYWAHSFGPPLDSILKALADLPGDLQSMISRTTTPIGSGDPLSWQSRNVIDVIFLGVCAAGFAAAWRRVPRAYVIYAGVQLAVVTSFPTQREPMMGLARYMLPMFALFMGAGAYLSERRAAGRITLCTSALLLVVFSGLWGYWSLVP